MALYTVAFVVFSFIEALGRIFEALKLSNAVVLLLSASAYSYDGFVYAFLWMLHFNFVKEWWRSRLKRNWYRWILTHICCRKTLDPDTDLLLDTEEENSMTRDWKKKSRKRAESGKGGGNPDRIAHILRRNLIWCTLVSIIHTLEDQTKTETTPVTIQNFKDLTKQWITLPYPPSDKDLIIFKQSKQRLEINTKKKLRYSSVGLNLKPLITKENYIGDAEEIEGDGKTETQMTEKSEVDGDSPDDSSWTNSPEGPQTLPDDNSWPNLLEGPQPLADDNLPEGPQPLINDNSLPFGDDLSFSLSNLVASNDLLSFSQSPLSNAHEISSNDENSSGEEEEAEISEEENSEKEEISGKEMTEEVVSFSSSSLFGRLKPSFNSMGGEMKCLFWDYTPKVFSNLRYMNGIPDDVFYSSLDPVSILLSSCGEKSGGRSGSFFIQTPDKKFLLKTIPKNEAHLIRKILPNYYSYLAYNPNSLLSFSRLYGSYGVKVPPGQKLYIVALGNIFNTDNILHERYDLKGSWINRTAGKNFNPVKHLGMDIDFKRKLNLPPKIKELFIQQISSDSKFLQSLGLIDYSLLIGIHKIDTEKTGITGFKASVPTKHPFDDRSKSPFGDDDIDPFDGHIQTPSFSDIIDQSKFHNYQGGVLSEDGTEIYYLGIIDFLTSYNYSKKQERFLKTKILRKDKKGVSVQNPAKYSDRFVKSMCNIIS